MIESLIALVVVLWLAFKVQEKMAKKQPAAQPAGQPALQPQPPVVVRTLDIEGTARVDGNLGFVKSYGLNPRDVRDLQLFKGPATRETLPPRVLGCLQKCFADGGTRGPDAPGVLFRGEPLVEGQGIYFALIERQRSAPSIVAFVHRVPTAG